MEKPKAYAIAEKQREISISEFFTKNRHLLGFDNPTRALLMAVKEAVDNALDACDEVGVLPEILVQLKKISDERFVVIVEDNGPGIVKKNIPNVFGKLLYGSKFHTLKQNRGQQGIGISAVVLYAQLTTGKPIKVISRISAREQAHYYELLIDTQRNQPKIINEKAVDWKKEHGTRIEVELEGRYQKGRQSVDEYLKQVAIVNPHAKITYITPDKQRITYARVTNSSPKQAKEIKPHPYGVEIGTLFHMVGLTNARTLQSFLVNDFCRVGPKTAKEICKLAGLGINLNPKELSREQAEKLLKAIKQTKIPAPPTDCLSPIGDELLEKSLKKEVKADFYVSVTRSPSVYRGFPFVVEVALAYGGKLSKEEPTKLLRFANRVPLLYQQGACAITEAFTSTNWRSYGIQQPAGGFPIGPMIVVVHLCSVWVPFTSESKEAVAHYPEIIKEIKLALQECGRKLGAYIRKKVKAEQEAKRISLFEVYTEEVAQDLSRIVVQDKENIKKTLLKTLEKNEKAGNN